MPETFKQLLEDARANMRQREALREGSKVSTHDLSQRMVMKATPGKTPAPEPISLTHNLESSGLNHKNNNE